MTGEFPFKLLRRAAFNCLRLLSMLCALPRKNHAAYELPATKVPANIVESKSNSVTLPFEFRRSHIVIQARLNESEPLSFMLDTGYSMPMISADLAETLKLKRVNQVTIVGIAGSEDADVFEGATFDLAGLTYAPRRVGAFPSVNNRRPRRRDGVLGYGFFRRFVVEIDHRAKMIQLHEPTNFTYTGNGEIVPLKFRRTTPIVTAEIRRPGHAPVSGQFEVDTGCDGGL